MRKINSGLKLDTNLEEAYPTYDAHSILLEPCLSIGSFIGVSFRTTCCLLHIFFGKSSKTPILS